jgi:hypothetical protein
MARRPICLTMPASTLVQSIAERRSPFPAPYRAAMAICSDLDETPDAETYFELMRFLNTTEETSMGPGVGLEVGNSIYFDMPPGHFSYWNATGQDREKIRTLIKSGHIDCLHSFGDLATTRDHAVRALSELESHGCRLAVWVDHSKAPTNFGRDIMHGYGDVPGHSAYHADMTLAHGIRYIWRGRVTSVIGQNSPASLRGIADRRHPVASGKTVLKEGIKNLLGRMDGGKYALHAPNRVLQPARLRDGREGMHEILRCNPHWGGVSCGDNGIGIAEVLAESFLDRLIERRGACILYTHLGKLGGRRQFGAETVQAFRVLASYAEDKILVTTTRRLLDLLSGVEDAELSSGFNPLQFPRLQ